MFCSTTRYRFRPLVLSVLLITSFLFSSTAVFADWREDFYDLTPQITELFANTNIDMKAELGAWSPSKRLDTAREIFQKLQNFYALDQARDYIVSQLEDLVPYEDIDDLEEYVIAIKENIKNFRDTFLYTDNYIQLLLEHYLQEDNFTIIPPAIAIFENNDLFPDAVRNALQATLVGNIVAMPIHMNGNHWVGAVFRQQANGNIQVIFNDPLVATSDGHIVAQRIRTLIQEALAESELAIEINIADLQHEQQRNGRDCGPFTVDNLVRIAQYAHENENALDNLHESEILFRIALARTIDYRATAIRYEHGQIIPIFNVPITGEIDHILRPLFPEADVDSDIDFEDLPPLPTPIENDDNEDEETSPETLIVMSPTDLNAASTPTFQPPITARIATSILPLTL